MRQVSLNTLLWVLVAFACHAVIGATADAETDLRDVTIVGLGNMGTAIAECLTTSGKYRVHGWNKADDRLRDARRLVSRLNNFAIYDDLSEAVNASELTLLTVIGDVKGKAAESVIKAAAGDKDDKDNVWKGKTLLQFSTHDPLTAMLQSDLLKSYGANFISGAMLAVPSTVCQDDALYLVSPSEVSSEALSKTAMPLLQQLGGATKVLDGDISHASLLDFGLLQSLLFGLAGHEMAHLVMDRYNAPQHLRKEYSNLVVDFIPKIYPKLLRLFTDTMLEKDWEVQGEEFFTTEALLPVLQMHDDFIDRLGLVDDTHITAYSSYLDMVRNGRYGQSRLTEEYIIQDVCLNEEECSS